MVAAQTMILNDSTPFSRTPVPSASAALDASSGAHTAPGCTKAPPNRVEIERQHLIALGLLTEVIGMLLASRRGSTVQIYNLHGRPFQRGVLPMIWICWRRPKR